MEEAESWVVEALPSVVRPVTPKVPEMGRLDGAKLVAERLVAKK